MQTLGISNSTPQNENRLKSLFWPSIQSGADVDYLGSQGYWVCAIVAVISLVISVLLGQPYVGVLVFVFYFVGGAGVRERSAYAATVVFVMFLLDTIASPGVLKLILLGLLLSNMRATYLASDWKPESAEAAMPPRFGETWSDKFADKLPPWLWPKVRILYYIYSVCLLLLGLFGLAQRFGAAVCAAAWLDRAERIISRSERSFGGKSHFHTAVKSLHARLRMDPAWPTALASLARTTVEGVRSI